jgi:PBP1b-binding outer membrane lipoprotein LpoB
MKIIIVPVLAMLFLVGCGKNPAGEQSNYTNAPATNAESASPSNSSGMNMTPPNANNETINKPAAGTLTNPPAITNETSTNNPATTNQ